MRSRNIFSFWIGSFLFATLLFSAWSVKAAEPVDGNDRGERSDIRVEIFLSPERKEEVDAVKKEFEALSITNVHPQVFRKGHPPQNIGFGKEIPAEVARQAIALALKYNDGIRFFLPEKRLAAHYVGIGVSIFDEAFQIPAAPDDLKRLSDPSLTDAQFHQIYQELTDKPPRINR